MTVREAINFIIHSKLKGAEFKPGTYFGNNKPIQHELLLVTNESIKRTKFFIPLTSQPTKNVNKNYSEQMDCDWTLKEHLGRTELHQMFV